MLTKKHFIALASFIREHNRMVEAGSESGKFEPAHIFALADFLRMENPQFKRERWIGYFRGECGPNGGEIK